MNLNHLYYFISAAKYESITKAADAVHMSQPSITAAIKELEKEFSLRLFDRVGNKITLTDSGREFLALTNNLVLQVDDFSKKVSELNSQHHATLKIGIPTVLGSFLLEKISPSFEEANPHIRLEIEEVPTLIGTTRIQDSRLDLLIGISDDRCYPNCSSSVIFKTDLQLALNRNHPLATEKKITDDMVANLPFIIISRGSYHYEAIMKRFSNSPLNVVLQSNQIVTIRHMLESNLAVTILYKEVFQNDPNICYIPFEVPMNANISVYWHKNAYLTTAMKTFIEHLMHITRES